MIQTLGLDVSLNRTGVAVIQNGRCEETGLIIPVLRDGKKKRPLRGLERQKFIITRIEEILKLYRFDSVAIENYSFASKGSAVHQLAEIGGVIRYFLYTRNIHYQTFSPQTLKKFLVGHMDLVTTTRKKMDAEERRENRKRSKEAMVNEARRSILISAKEISPDFDDNQADAYTLAKLMWAITYYKKHDKMPKGLTEIQEQVVRAWSKKHEEA